MNAAEDVNNADALPGTSRKGHAEPAHETGKEPLTGSNSTAQEDFGTAPLEDLNDGDSPASGPEKYRARWDAKEAEEHRKVLKDLRLSYARTLNRLRGDSISAETRAREIADVRMEHLENLRALEAQRGPLPEIGGGPLDVADESELRYVRGQAEELQRELWIAEQVFYKGVDEEDLRREVKREQARVLAREAFNAPVVGKPLSPADLTDIVNGIQDGTLSKPQPSVGMLTDGETFLFYRGAVNGIHGDSNSGKTMTALAVAAQEIEAGRDVFWIDLESGQVPLISRLLDMGVQPEYVIERFVYWNPTTALTQEDRDALLAQVNERGPSLVVIDSVGEALALQGIQPNADEEVARWFQELPRAIANCGEPGDPEAAGPAVVGLDHSTKAGDNKLMPINSQRKVSAVSGAQYLQEVVTPFDRETPGASVLISAKDREGHHRRGAKVAHLRVDSTDGTLRVALEPALHQESSPVDKRARTKEVISEVLTGDAKGLGLNKLRGKVREKFKASNDEIGAAADEMAAEGYINITERGQSKIHTLIKPYVPEFDDGEELP